MIAQQQIQVLAKRYQTTELNVRREYVQHLFLSTFYEQPETEGIFFKGGTALRVIYHSPRFSEDLDFSARYRGVKEVEQAVTKTLVEIERQEIQPTIQEAKVTSGGYLAQIVFTTGGQLVTLQLHISLREGKKRGALTTIINDFLPPYTLFHLVQDQLIQEKIQALLIRQKPRDFYDLYFILRANLLSVREKHLLPEVIKTLSQTRANFEKELKLFLPKSHWPILKNFKTVLEKEMQRFL